MLHGGLVSLQAILEDLKPSERKVADFILAHPEEVVKLSVQKLAELSGVSEATIIRLARSLNMKGYQELKLRIAGDLNKQTATGSYKEIMMEGSVESIMQAVSWNNIQSIQDTLSVLSGEEVARAVDALAKARKIDVYGVGASAVIAADIRQKFSRINLWCEAYSDFHAQLTSAVTLSERDVAFGISYSGQTEDIIQSLTEARQQGATIITLTKFGPSPVAELADIRLFTSSVEKSIRSGAMASRIAQLNVIDILFITLVSRQQEEVIPLLEKTRLAVSRTKRS
ncbi:MULTISPECIES: MurR/RpiR family transcriptional regulator [Brevibacillus]|jgi:DNA-binding MurR/RpiR family transcriptional regulator|uniref:MurR/RpiR family transcriptional regulator n=1 Tax=Brevibacillus TaxID=55080 RepID=UPI000468B06A|nr:MurR/RpiR family transcriptional regulator [Brevibacillus borstelensis]KKX55461.1 RpiR family transcriptional regulator [Brevibacillus borstelensis cifa_chp40]MBE5397574.1 MurR/RpiR family transcriptional regulator [Brevibacillus borstelensis]MCC0564985.1 MurR/RpiR family transcriptional regulator [Brevibacillus borstelensis]MCM3469215.1 MurR/RpiR family transcriptional regulator [Brevibacillus borstelensis]MCM3560104.1 MurR/RpiR family transcriptional regulator [Brevibacillus borstelensis]